MYIVLLRHSESILSNTETDTDSENNPHISDLGKKQAIETGKYLTKHFYFSKIYSSTLKRASDTAFIIAQKNNYNKKITYDEVLNEKNKGLFSNINKQEKKNIINNNPIIKLWYSSFKNSDTFAAHKLRLKIASKYFEVSKQESTEDLEKRAKSIIYRITNENKEDDDILIVTHASIINAIILYLFNMKLSHYNLPRNLLPNEKTHCHITIIKYINKKFYLEMAVDNTHLKEMYDNIKNK